MCIIKESCSKNYIRDLYFQALNHEGILVFAQQSSHLGQDFISIILKEGYVEFAYDLGTGPAFIKHPHKIKIGHWHRIQAKRWHRYTLYKICSSDKPS